MAILYKNLFKHVILRGHIFIFLQITVVIKIYCTFKIEKIVYHKNFVFFSFLQLDYIRGTYSKYFENNIYEADISSVTKKTTS